MNSLCGCNCRTEQAPVPAARADARVIAGLEIRVGCLCSLRLIEQVRYIGLMRIAGYGLFARSLLVPQTPQQRQIFGADVAPPAPNPAMAVLAACVRATSSGVLFW